MATTEAVDNFPGFENGIDGFELGEKMQRGAERFGAKVKYATVLGAELSGDIKTVRTSAGDIDAKTVIYAAGASPQKLGLQNESELVGRGVAYCATCDGMRYRGKTVAVAGGGNSAVADALTLSAICKRVIIVHRRDKLRADRVYENALAKAENIEFVWNASIDGFDADSEGFNGLKLTDKITGKHFLLPCDGVFIAIGRKPNTEIIKDALTLDKSGYIAALEDTVTNVPGVFAAGDVRTKPLRQIVTAAADGATAAKAAELYLLQNS